MIPAYRRIRWVDGFHVGECLCCSARVSDPESFCTRCGTEWTHCIIDTPADAFERKPGRGDGYVSRIERDIGVHPLRFLLQRRDTLFGELGEWYTFDSAIVPGDAIKKMRRWRERDDDEGMLYRIVPEK